MQFEMEFGDLDTPTRQPKSSKVKRDGNATAVVSVPSQKSGRKTGPLERRFEKLWTQLEEKQQRHKIFDREVERARSWIHTELAQKRDEYKSLLVKQTERLISHLGKKSLLKWQRQVLGSWIEENFERLESSCAPELPGMVRRYYAAKLSGLSKAERTAIEEYYEESIEDIVAGFEENHTKADEDDINAEDAPQEDTRQQSEYHAEEPDKEPEEESFAEKMRAHEKQQKRKVFDKSLVNKLFRRTARALHPDHEQDGARREEKQALMKTLLQARKSGDVALIFQMYREHVDNATIEIDLPDLQPMVDLLEQQIADLDEQFFSKTRESAMHEWVGKRVLGQTDKGQLDAFAELKKDLEDDISRVQRLFPHLGSLAKLKPLLEERYEMDMIGFFY